ncbi:MAG: hypothetical protein KAU27_07105 [Desulfuromonadales bacterium]|nr:hypothetical protein [Desulfuromonadales bacterium]
MYWINNTFSLQGATWKEIRLLQTWLKVRKDIHGLVVAIIADWQSKTLWFARVNFPRWLIIGLIFLWQRMKTLNGIFGKRQELADLQVMIDLFYVLKSWRGER